MMRPTIDRPVRTPPPLKVHVGLGFFRRYTCSPTKTTERIAIRVEFTRERVSSILFDDKFRVFV